MLPLLYGITVVVLIASIIVDFYNEMKSENEDEPENRKPLRTDRPQGFFHSAAGFLLIQFRQTLNGLLMSLIRGQ